MESAYLVAYAPDSIGGDFKYVRVSARTFISVEDWAMDNVPAGKYLWSIEKVYGTEHSLSTMFGEADITIDSFPGHSVKVTPEEFDAMTREPEAPSAYAVRASVERGI